MGMSLALLNIMTIYVARATATFDSLLAEDHRRCRLFANIQDSTGQHRMSSTDTKSALSLDGRTPNRI